MLKRNFFDALKEYKKSVNSAKKMLQPEDPQSMTTWGFNHDCGVVRELPDGSRVSVAIEFYVKSPDEGKRVFVEALKLLEELRKDLHRQYLFHTYVVENGALAEFERTFRTNSKEAMKWIDPISTDDSANSEEK